MRKDKIYYREDNKKEVSIIRRKDYLNYEKINKVKISNLNENEYNKVIEELKEYIKVMRI